MSLESLMEIYAEVNEISYYDADAKYIMGQIDKFDLLDAWLENEGIIGYGYIFRELFELLEEL